VIRLDIRTQRRAEFVDITARIQEALSRAGDPSASLRASSLLPNGQGLATIFVPHTTAGITINENADPDVVADILEALERLVPRRGDYRHTEGNADAHVKASLMGSSVRVPLDGGRLALGTWQGIYFCEFDGPRRREVWVAVTPAP
jgi:secondary thiamine-phosphate synthase enzyme